VVEGNFETLEFNGDRSLELSRDDGKYVIVIVGGTDVRDAVQVKRCNGR
jgi:hypothetical protein